MRKKRIISMICMLVVLLSNFSIPVYANPLVNIVDTSKHTYSFLEMQEDIALLDFKYPDRIEVSSVGTSVDGRAIHQIIIGNKNAKNAIYIQASIHGREWMNTWILMESLEMCLDNWDTGIAFNGKTYGQVFQNCCIYLLPMVNPDGVTISQYGLNAINNEAVRNNCKLMRGANNPSKWKANANGVDLNRNFSAGWNSKIDVLAPSSDFFNGVAPFTEPESIAIKNALNLRKFVAAITYHSMEGAIYWDLGQEGKLREQTFALATHCKNITGYKLGDTATAKGLDYNYMILDKKIPSVCIETGTVACPLPYSQFKVLWKQNGLMMPTLAACYQ